MDPLEEFKVELEELLKKYGFSLNAGDMDADIDLRKDGNLIGYWSGTIPGELAKL